MPSKTDRLVKEMLLAKGLHYGEVGQNLSQIKCDGPCRRLLGKNEGIGIDYETENIWKYYCLHCADVAQQDQGVTDEKTKGKQGSRGRTGGAAAQKKMRPVPRWGRGQSVSAGR